MLDLPIPQRPHMQVLALPGMGSEYQSAVAASVAAFLEASLELGKVPKTVGRLSVQWLALERIAGPETLHLPSVERLPPHGDEELDRALPMVDAAIAMAAACLLPHVVGDLCQTARQRAVVVIRKLRTHHDQGPCGE